jgi:hypothetical protein
VLGRLLCTMNRHDWERMVNPEVGGKDAVYSLCRRCGKEKAEYDPPTPGQATGFGGGI